MATTKNRTTSEHKATSDHHELTPELVEALNLLLGVSGQNSALELVEALNNLLGLPEQNSTLELVEAINLLLRIIEGTPDARMASCHRGWLLWEKFISPSTRPSDVREYRRDDNCYVDLGDFTAWVLSNRGVLPVLTEVWTPETAEAKCNRLKAKLERSDRSEAEDEKTRQAILEMEALQRRFSETVAAIGKKEDSGAVAVAREAKDKPAKARNKDMVKFAKWILDALVAQGWFNNVDDKIPYLQKEFMKAFYANHSKHEQLVDEYSKKVLVKLGIRFSKGGKLPKDQSIQRLIDLK